MHVFHKVCEILSYMFLKFPVLFLIHIHLQFIVHFNITHEVLVLFH